MRDTIEMTYIILIVVTFLLAALNLIMALVSIVRGLKREKEGGAE